LFGGVYNDDEIGHAGPPWLTSGKEQRSGVSGKGVWTALTSVSRCFGKRQQRKHCAAAAV